MSSLGFSNTELSLVSCIRERSTLSQFMILILFVDCSPRSVHPGNIVQARLYEGVLRQNNAPIRTMACPVELQTRVREDFTITEKATIRPSIG